MNINTKPIKSINFKRVIRVLCGFVCIVNASISLGQDAFTTFDHTSGLQLDKIQVIKEDSLGYLWLGGTSGVSKFDGYRFTNYHLGDTSYHVAGNVVNDIEITPKGDVVIAYDDKGLSIFNHKTQSFRTKQYESNDGDDFPRYSIFFVYILNDSMAYLGANREGLYLFNLHTFESRKVAINLIPKGMIGDPNNPNSYYITANGLFHFNSEDTTATRLTPTGFNGLKSFDNRIWYKCYFYKVSSYDPQSGETTDYAVQGDGVIRGWAHLGEEIWVGTPDGIQVVNVSTGNIDRVVKAGKARTDLKGHFIYSMHKDGAGRVWIGTDGGLSMYDPNKQFFTEVNWLSHQVSSLSKLKSNDLLALDFYERTAILYDNNLSGYSLTIPDDFKNPIGIIQTPHRELVHFFNGIGEIDLPNKRIVNIDCPFNHEYTRGLVDLSIDNNLWLALYRYSNNLIVWDKDKNTLDTIHLETEPRSLTYAEDDTYLLCGVDLLAQYDARIGKLTRIPLDVGMFDVLGSDLVKIDKVRGEYWISTKNKGMWKARFSNGTLQLGQHYGIAQGLRNLSIVETTCDQNGCFIVMCRSDIFRYNPELDRFSMLGDDNDINTTATYGIAAIDDVVYALGYNSKSLRLHDRITSVSNMQPIIEKIRINGNKIFSNSNSLNLHHHENNISIGFSTIDFVNPKNIKHRYRLNTNQNWVELDRSTNEVHLASLNDGNYEFQLSASYGDGKWYPPTKLLINIQPPLWKRWWFLLLSGLLIASGSAILYKLRIRHIHRLNKMQLRLSELESESLRAQMNPHFVFNALNSIKSYIIKSSVYEAADYLTTFSELIRAVLHNSKQKVVSLGQELEALTLYLQIENFRLNQKFDYQVEVDDGIDVNKVMIPPLIIQPFVENSIWHGFIHKPSKALLIINVSSQHDMLQIDIIDDGVGRDASRRIEKNRKRKRSYGIAITKKRLENLTNKTQVMIKDLYDEKGLPKGTKVTLTLPLQLNHLN